MVADWHQEATASCLCLTIYTEPHVLRQWYCICLPFMPSHSPQLAKTFVSSAVVSAGHLFEAAVTIANQSVFIRIMVDNLMLDAGLQNASFFRFQQVICAYLAEPR